MDPNETLRLMVQRAEAIADRDENPARDFYDASELANTVLALHDWIRRGGFLPAAWTPKAGAK